MKLFNNILIAIFIMLFFSVQISGQHNMHKKRKKIKERKLEFIKSELQLTEQEEKLFMPLYNEYDEKREKIHEERRGLMKNYKKNSLNLSDKKITEMSDKFIEYDFQTVTIRKEYHQKFKKVLPPVKILILYKSEHEFNKHLLKKMQKRKHRPPK